MVLMIDNYDSFTYNLVQYLGELSAEVVVKRNDEITVEEIEEMNPERIIISPGPCSPTEAGISMAVIDHFKDKLPMLGVCLGHQAIGAVFGGEITHAKEIMHGKTSSVYHTGEGVFAGLSSPYISTRYHSLVIKQNTLPDCLKVTAWTQNEHGETSEIMGVRHKNYAIEGVQFHPESILSEHGHDLLANFLNMEI